MQTGTSADKLQNFHNAFRKLKTNRERVPLVELQGRFGKQYNALVAEVIDGADWFFHRYMKVLAFPIHPKDIAGNEWLAKRIAAIEEEEKRPGGLVEQYRAALIERLDLAEFESLVHQGYERRLNEVFDPYWQRHCRRLDSGWVYNDIFNKFWLPPCEGYPSGGWINDDHSGWDGRFPPHLKEETL